MDKFKRDLIEEEKRAFMGWDFSSLKGRMVEEKLPWDYREYVLHYLKPNDKLLDMGTGGGEFLMTLEHQFSNTSVTEGYEPNVELCQKNLVPLGITVKQVYDDLVLPYEDDSFDIVINRHESYDVQEVKRVLKNNGIFITQQVGGRNNYELAKSIIPSYNSSFYDYSLESEVRRFEDDGFVIVYKNEFFSESRFYDVGAFVYFAKIIEWEFPGFSVETHFTRLKEMKKEIEEVGYIRGVEHRFILVAKNMKN